MMKVDLVSREFWYHDRKYLKGVMEMLVQFMDMSNDYSSLMESLEGDEQSWLERQEDVRKMLAKADNYLNTITDDTFFTNCDRCGKFLDELKNEDIFLENKDEVVCTSCCKPNEWEEKVND